MAEWSSHRIMFYAGLVVMLVFWVAAIVGAMIAVSLSSAYNMECTYQPPPLTTPVGCDRLAAQIGQAVTEAVLGGVAGLVGMVIALIGNKAMRKRAGMLGRAKPQDGEGAGPRGPA